MRYQAPRRYRSYVMSLAMGGILMTALILGSIGSVVEAVSRQGRFTDPTVQREQQSDTSNSKNTNKGSTTTNVSDTKKTTVTPQTTTTTPPASTTPTTTTQQPAPTQTAATQQPVSQAPVVTSQPKVVTPAAPPDTAVAAQTTTDAQADVASITKPVFYTSHQISNDVRDRIIMLAGVLGFSGLSLYAITFMRPKEVRQFAPQRIPVEVIAR
jgi:cytoskeletal protein RodZ